MNLMASLARFVVRRFRPNTTSVLRSLNDARTVLGLPTLDCIPQGRTRRMGACPVSRSLPGVVGVDGVAFAIPDQAIAVASIWRTSVLFSRTGVYIARLPATLSNFVRDFDLGAFPELVVGGADLESETASAFEYRGRKAA